MVANNIDSMNINKLGVEKDFSDSRNIYVQEAEVDGIEILVNLAKQGKIDPWNVDIVDVYDKYMVHLFQAKGQNLKMTGRTILFAAILLRLKSNILEGLDILDFEPQHEEDLEYNDEPLEYSQEEYVPTNNIISIDEVLQRRTSVRLNHNRVVTLRDLIRQLEFYEELDRKQAFKNSLERAKRRARSYENFSAEDIVNLAHDEYIEQTVNKLKIKLEEIFVKREKVELNSLVELGMDKISAYIALLFLSAESDIDLVQKEFYGELYIQKGSSEIQTEIA